MGRHSKVQPKKISLLATAGGIFATVLLAAGLFGTAQLITNPPESVPDNPHVAVPPRMIEIPIARANGQPEGSQAPPDGPINIPIESPQAVPTSIPRPEQPPAIVTPAPSVPDVTVPELLSTSVDTDLPKALDVDAEARVGSLLSVEVEVKPTKLPEIKLEISPVAKLLGE